MNWVLQDFDSEAFIKQYWQKKPCLIRNAFADLGSPVSPEELAGLACEEEVHSRLVLEKAGDRPWQLRYGPFEEADFLSLPETHYSLLVSECEKWIPEFSDLLNCFRFIPLWRIDDVMLSYAPPGGSVGPHTDEYDVFLLQIQGQRNWQYTDQRVDNPALLANLDLAIMQDFVADQEAVLEPGDMLYLPPGVAHHGVAIDPCLTCSIGFRAPTATEVLESFTLEVDKKELGLQRYSDPNLETKRHFGEITDTEIDRFKRLALQLLDQPQSHWLDTIGKLLSDSTVSESGDPAGITDNSELEAKDWASNPDSKMLYHCQDSQIRFYYNGQVVELPYTDSRLDFVQQLCANADISFHSKESWQHDKELLHLCLVLINARAVLPIDEL